MNTDNTGSMEPHNPGHDPGRDSRRDFERDSGHNHEHNPGGTEAPEAATTVLVARSMSAARSTNCPFTVLCGPHVTEYDLAALEALAHSAALEALDLVCFNLGDADNEGALRQSSPELPVVPALTRISFTNCYHGVFTGATLFSKMQVKHDIVPDTSNMLVSTEMLRSLEPSEGLDLSDASTRITLAFRLAHASSTARCVAQKLGEAHVPNSLGMLGRAQDATAMQAAEALSRLVSGFQRMMGEMCADGAATDPHFRNAVMGCWAEITDDATHALSDHSLLDEAFLQLTREGASGEGIPRVPELSDEEVSGVPGVSEILREEALETLWLADLLSHMVAESRFDRNLRWREWRAWAAETRVGELERSKTYRAGRIVTAIPRKLRDLGGSTGHPEQAAQTTPSPGIRTADAANAATNTADNSRKVRLVGSIASFPPRIDTVHLCIERLMEQTILLDAIELHLARTQFPRLEDDLPESLLALVERGLSIRFDDLDMGSHKKYLRAMADNPDSAIITLDDDILCERDTVELLYRSYLEHPNAVSAIRVHRIRFDADGRPAPYATWETECKGYVGEERMDLLATNGAGSLFPPHCLPDSAFDLERILALAPNADDLWLKFNETCAGVPTVHACEGRPLITIDGSQDAASLWSINRLSDGNDSVIAALLREFDVSFRSG